ncbi:zinc finger c2h2-type protein [Rutstroemia sp. NJR-2017a BVV2]|nr:zinc finger c2h2-type protein [Rutstroemia sp. NJR-2017a BVV2]
MEANNNSKEKGKGKSEPQDPSSQDDPPAPASSLLSRVSASASGLTRSAFAAAPGASDLRNGGAAAMLAGSGKAGAQSGGSGGAGADWGESSRGGIGPATAGAGGEMRGEMSAGTQDHIRESEEQFSRFLDGVEGVAPSALGEGEEQDRGLGQAEVREWGYEGRYEDGQVDGSRHSPQPETSKAFEMVWERTRSSKSRSGFEAKPGSSLLHGGEDGNGYKSIPEQEAHDGEEVLDLLNSSSTVGTFAYPSISEFEKERYEEENVDWGLSPQQIKKIREISGRLLGELHEGVDVDNVLNLRPSFGNEMGMDEESLRDWEGVLNGYTDEVWGGLAPLVREAREEVEKLKEGRIAGEEKGDVKALRRLRAVLGHLGRS